MSENNYRQTIELNNDDEQFELFGQQDRKLRMIEKLSGCELYARGYTVTIVGEEEKVERAVYEIRGMLDLIRAGQHIEEDRINSIFTNGVRKSVADNRNTDPELIPSGLRVEVRPKTPNQRMYLETIYSNVLTFATGPAGTGKTYLAVAMAIGALKQKLVERIILTRPAVEAGESLGFLPGDIKEKVDPYFRPLYDALYELVGIDKAKKLITQEVIEIAPLAFMRGRTLSKAFIILDEAQNSTRSQMKMLLTRLGFGSKMVVNGDITQLDLPSGQESGLVAAMKILEGIDGIGVIRFEGVDIVRHNLVQKIIEAYEELENGTDS